MTKKLLCATLETRATVRRKQSAHSNGRCSITVVVICLDVSMPFDRFIDAACWFLKGLSATKGSLESVHKPVCSARNEKQKNDTPGTMSFAAGNWLFLEYLSLLMVVLIDNDNFFHNLAQSGCSAPCRRCIVCFLVRTGTSVTVYQGGVRVWAGRGTAWWHCTSSLGPLQTTRLWPVHFFWLSQTLQHLSSIWMDTQRSLTEIWVDAHFFILTRQSCVGVHRPPLTSFKQNWQNVVP